MVIKGDFRLKSLYVFIFLVAVAIVLFGAFAMMVARTDVNIISGAVSVIKSTISGSISASLAKIEGSSLRMYRVAIIESIVLITGIITSLFGLLYLFKHYYLTVQLSLIDELTRLYNRRALYKILDVEIKRAKRFKHPLTILMADIDFFKVYNDTNGHVAGDVLLQKISKMMQESIRDIDTIGRYGGEEFLAILPETSHKNAARIAERIRKKIENGKFKGQEKQPLGKVTLSLGLATFHGDYKEGTQLIHSADQLLYEAKRAGRNQVKKAYFGRVDKGED